MDDVWVRVAVVAGALAVGGLIAVWQRSRSKKPSRQVHAPHLEPGVYLFTSTACATCARARKGLETQLGDGYSEYVWEEDPAMFAELRIDAVPAVLVMGEGRMGTLHFGRPPRSLVVR